MVNQPLKIIKNSQKLLPCNIEAEQALIGSILVSNDIYDEISPMVESIITENKHLHQLTRQGYDKVEVQDILRKIIA